MLSCSFGLIQSRKNHNDMLVSLVKCVDIRNGQENCARRTTEQCDNRQQIRLDRETASPRI